MRKTSSESARFAPRSTKTYLGFLPVCCGLRVFDKACRPCLCKSPTLESGPEKKLVTLNSTTLRARMTSTGRPAIYRRCDDIADVASVMALVEIFARNREVEKSELCTQSLRLRQWVHHIFTKLLQRTAAMQARPLFRIHTWLGGPKWVYERFWQAAVIRIVEHA